jgi:flagellar motor switch protein FliN/FliY
MIQALTTVDDALAATMSVRVELGSTTLNLQEAAHLCTGAVVALNATLDHSVMVYVDDRLVARGKIVVVEGKFCVRVTELTVGRR